MVDVAPSAETASKPSVDFANQARGGKRPLEQDLPTIDQSKAYAPKGGFAGLMRVLSAKFRGK